MVRRHSIRDEVDTATQRGRVVVEEAVLELPLQWELIAIRAVRLSIEPCRTCIWSRLLSRLCVEAGVEMGVILRTLLVPLLALRLLQLWLASVVESQLLMLLDSASNDRNSPATHTYAIIKLVSYEYSYNRICCIFYKTYASTDNS